MSEHAPRRDFGRGLMAHGRFDAGATASVAVRHAGVARGSHLRNLVTGRTSCVRLGLLATKVDTNPANNFHGGSWPLRPSPVVVRR
jgi:outer membrane receptor for monomeric catechols